jgi:hypothetical protein
MTTSPDAEITKIELLAVKCRRDSILRTSFGHFRETGCTSLVAFCHCPRGLEPEWVLLPGLYLLDDELEHLRRVRIHHDQESFVIVGYESIPTSSELNLARFAALRIGADGDLIDFEIWSAPTDPRPIVLTKDYAHVLANCTT